MNKPGRAGARFILSGLFIQSCKAVSEGCDNLGRLLLIQPLNQISQLTLIFDETGKLRNIPTY